MPPAVHDAAGFHRGLDGYAPTPVRSLDGIAAGLGLGAVLLKDESDRLGLPAFKVLGASWAVERALREQPDAHTLVTASAGNHGRAVAHVAARRGLRCRVFLPRRSLAIRREAIAGEGAEVVVIEGDYEEAVASATAAGAEPGALEIADVGPPGGPPAWVIDGYATLFSEAAAQAEYDAIVVPVGVGSLAAAAARHGAERGVPVTGVEPAAAACLTASLAAGEPTAVADPGHDDGGARLRGGLRGGVALAAPRHRRGASPSPTRSPPAAMAELAALGLTIGECGAAPLAALRRLMEPDLAGVRAAAGIGPGRRVLLIATEGRTGG